jgi:dienelactone hydrolase
MSRRGASRRDARGGGPGLQRPTKRRAWLVAVVAVVTGCGGGDDDDPHALETATPTATAEPAAACEGTLGRGRVGVVAVSGPGGGPEQWCELARALARRGLRVVVETDTPEEVGAAVRRLRRDGASRVTLLSTSSGGATAIDAAGAGADVDAIVALSASRYGDGTDLLPRAREVGAPMLHIGSRRDPDTVDGEDTRALGGTGRFELVGGDAHGTELVAEYPRLVGDIAAFLRLSR